jgi:hypothetical protein
MSADCSPADRGISTETVAHGNDGLLEEKQLTSSVPVQGKIFFNFNALNIMDLRI